MSSLTAAVSRTLKDERFPMTRTRVLALTRDRVVEGWELNYFLSKALKSRKYPDLRSVMIELEDWLDAQG